MSSSITADAKLIILVTGANKGIGYETAKQLAQQLPHSTVLLGTRSLDNGDAAIKQMRADADTTGPLDNILPLAIDVVDQSSIDKAVEHVKSKYGRLDVLIHNSGISNVNGNPKDTAVLDVNFDGARAAIEAFVPIIPPTTGLIVLVSSTVGSYAAAAMQPELQQELTDDPASMTWPKLQTLRADWEAFVANQPSRYQWAPREEVTGHYQVSKALVNGYARMRAAQHSTPKLVLVCPGFCATDLNGHRGTDTPAKGATSVYWPLYHADEAKHGVLYQHSVEIPYIQAAPAEYTANIKRMVAEMAAKREAAGQKQ